MKRMHRLIFFMVPVLLLMGCRHTEAPVVSEDTPTLPPEDLSALGRVLAKGGDPFPELAALDAKALLAGPFGKEVMDWAMKAAETESIPETTYTLYGEFQRSGVRDTYQKPYYAKRTLLTQEVMRVWIGGDDSRMSRVNDLIWNICEESTWVVPAHYKGPDTIDLFSAETATQLSAVLMVLKDRLPEDIRSRIQSEIKKRIFDLYLEHGETYWWRNGSNNWTGVCAGSVGEAFLLLEKDPDRLAAAIDRVITQLKRFIDKGFEEDGGCLEGINYWNYGLKHFVIFSEMLRHRTGGEIDLLADPKLKGIAAYPTAVHLGGGKYVSFSDANETASVNPMLAASLGDRTGVTALRDLAADTITEWNLMGLLHTLAWWDGKRPNAVSTQTIFLPKSGLARLVDSSAGVPMVVAVKGGSNAEPHNHNDVGSFIVHADGEIYLCDPGRGLYTRDYFNKHRYENIFANSYGHSVPRFGDYLQQTGEAYRGEAEMVDAHTVRVRFDEAYGIPGLRKLERTLHLEKDRVTLTDKAAFSSDALPMEEAFLTWLPVEISGGTAKIISPKGVLTLESADGTFEAEPLKEACAANRKDRLLTRLRISYPAAPKREVGVTMRYSPK